MGHDWRGMCRGVGFQEAKRLGLVQLASGALQTGRAEGILMRSGNCSKAPNEDIKPLLWIMLVVFDEGDVELMRVSSWKERYLE